MKNKYPFEGLKILDFHWVGAGPWATSFFADFGASVIRCESRSAPDPFRLTPPFKDNKPTLNSSYMFNMLNSNKLSLGVNMKNEKEENNSNKRLNLILIAILVVEILDFVTRIIKG